MGKWFESGVNITFEIFIVFNPFGVAGFGELVDIMIQNINHLIVGINNHRAVNFGFAPF